MIGLPTTPVVSLILAQNKDGVIGINGKLPWKHKEDLAFYKANTVGKVVIVGRKTFESLPMAALSKRHHIVITRQESLLKDENGARNVSFVRSIEQAFMKGLELNTKAPTKLNGIVFAGGYSIYKDAAKLGLVDEYLITTIGLETPVGCETIAYSPFSKCELPTPIEIDSHESWPLSTTWRLHVRGDTPLEKKLFLKTKFRANLKEAGIK